MLDYQELTKKLESLKKHRPLTKGQQDALNFDIKVEHVWSSNAIEGSSINRGETASILANGITIRGELIKDILATLDLSEAYDYMVNLAPKPHRLTIADIRDFNRLTQLREKSQEAGSYRITKAYPYGIDDEPYVDPVDIPTQMNDLIMWANNAENTEHPIKYAADLHFKFISIHPFNDGNGRTARLLMNFTLMQNRYPVVNIQPDKDSRNHYINVLAKCRKERNPTGFEEYLAVLTSKALDQRIKILQLNDSNYQAIKNKYRT